MNDFGKDERFSVCQFFTDGNYEYTRRHVPLEEAMGAFKHYTTSVAVTMGVVARVIVTDSGDCIVAEWINGKGITWPVPETTKKE